MNVARPILEARHLSREVGPSGNRKAIVSDFTYSFLEGNIYAILGPSGAGKSSLLRLFNRLDEPTSGEIILKGKNYRLYSPCKLRRSTGYLFQTPYLFPGSVEENLLFANSALDSRQIDQLLAMASLKPEIKIQNTHKLSVGEMQRVALARLLATKPTVILLDEPTSALDPTYTEMIETAIRQIVARQKLTAIIVSHHPQQALRMGGEALLIVSGRLVEHGPAKVLVENPKTEMGRRYRDRGLA